MLHITDELATQRAKDGGNMAIKKSFCPYCGARFLAANLNRHMKACLRKSKGSQ